MSPCTVQPDEFKAARIARGLSQQDVAALIGIAVGTVSRFERGVNRPHRLIAARMAEVVGLPDRPCDGSGTEALLRPPSGGAASDDSPANGGAAA
jgi:transcriptional regulator with XRE-family HTH domain